MKKLILFLTLLFVGISANAQYTPSNNLNYVKLIKVPPVGSVEDSVLVYDGSDSFVKMIPKSSVVAGKESVSNKTSSIANYSETLYTNEKAVHDALDLKLNISDLPTNLTLYPTNVASDVGGYVKMVTDIHDADYNTVAVDVSTPTITGTAQLVSQRISAPGVLIGQPGVFNITTFGNIKRLSGTGTANFYFEVYHRDLAGTETLICTSSVSDVVSLSTYSEFTASGIWDDGDFIETDRIVIKSYANRIAGGTDPVYQFQFGGTQPVRTLLPVPFSVVDAGYEIKTNKSDSILGGQTDSQGYLSRKGTYEYVEKKQKFLNSFVDVLKNNSSVKNCYFKKRGDSAYMALGVVLNGEAVQYNMFLDSDGLTRIGNIFTNTLSGNIMNESGQINLANGVLEFAIKSKRQGEVYETTYTPVHYAETGASRSVTREIYIDGVLTDVTLLATNTNFVINEFVMIQKFTGFNTNDVSGTYPLFNAILSHKFKDGVMAITVSLKFLDTVEVKEGYSSKIQGYIAGFDRLKYDNEQVEISVNDDSNSYLPIIPKSTVLYSTTNKYAIGLEIGNINESYSSGKSYGPVNGIRFWNRDPLTSYSNWVEFDTSTIFNTGDILQSTNRLFTTTNVTNLIK